MRGRLRCLVPWQYMRRLSVSSRISAALRSSAGSKWRPLSLTEAVAAVILPMFLCLHRYLRFFANDVRLKPHVGNIFLSMMRQLLSTVATKFTNPLGRSYIDYGFYNEVRIATLCCSLPFLLHLCSLQLFPVLSCPWH